MAAMAEMNAVLLTKGLQKERARSLCSSFFFFAALALGFQLRANRVHLDALLGREEQVHLVEHHHAHRRVLRAQPLDFVHLLGDGRRVGGALFERLVQHVLELLELVPFVSELGRRRLPDLVDLLRLLLRQAQLFLRVRMQPPLEARRIVWLRRVRLLRIAALLVAKGQGGSVRSS
jgi:hypothetical protein